MNRYRILASSLLIVSSITGASAALYWDGTDLTANADGGNGTWDTTTANWTTLLTGGSSTPWNATQSAIFTGQPGTVSIAAGGVSANGITFEASGYLLKDQTLSVGAGSIQTYAGVEATIQSALTGTSGVTKTGEGTLVLSGSNTYTGTTNVVAGTLKPAATAGFRYYRFTGYVNSGNDGYNQIGELHFYKNGVWIPAVAGSQTGTGTGEQLWSNANDNRGSSASFSKYGVGTRPYSITYDFGSQIAMDGYNWSSANDSTPSRNPKRWAVFGSNDNTNFVLLDDRSNVDQPGPTTTYTWAGSTGTYLAYNNAEANGGAANAYPLGWSGMPTTSPLAISSGAVFDMNDRHHTTPALTGSGSVINSGSKKVTLTVGTTTSATFEGTLSDFGASSAISLVKVSSGAQTLGGSESNTYSGLTTLAGNGKLVLAKTGGAIAIPGNIQLSSSAFAGNNSGVVLAGDEQIADTSVLTWTSSAYGLAATQTAVLGQSDSFFRLNGHTETVGGLVSNASGLPVIENRGNGDTINYGQAHLIVNVSGANVYTYAGQIRDLDGGSNGGSIAITKTGTGTQVLAGTMNGCTGPALVNQGVLRINNTLGSTTVTANGAGTLEGTGTLTGVVSVGTGGLLSPGVGGTGTLTCSQTVNVGDGGTLFPSGTSILNGGAILQSGALLKGNGTVSGAVTVQSGGEVSPGNANIGNLKVSGQLTLGGNVTMEINKAGATLTNDQISGFSKVNLGGTLTVVSTGATPELGDSFQLFAPGTGGIYAGMFSQVNGLPALAPGLQWETSTLSTTGRISVVNKASTPGFSLAGGGYVGEQSVSIFSDEGSTIYYTLDGSEPTTASTSALSPVTGITIPVDSIVTVKAFAVTPGFADSDVVTVQYRTVTTPQWVVDADGAWLTGTNWLNQVGPNGSGVLVDFTLPQTANRTVTLDTNRTVGSLLFSNSNPFTWTLASSGGSVLTLNVPSGVPTIQVSDVDTTISAVLAGSQGLSKTGAGNLTLSANNTVVGNLLIEDGILSVATISATGTPQPMGAGSSMSFNGGTLRYTGATSINGATFTRPIYLDVDGGTIDASTPTGFWFTTGVISGPGSLTKKGTRQLIVDSMNTYDGDTFVMEGEVQIRRAGALGSELGKTVVSNGARLAAGGGFGTATVAEDLELNGMGGNAGGALQVNDGGVVSTWSGSIVLASDSGVGGSQPIVLSGAVSGPGGLMKLGSNAVTMSGAESNSYAGTTVLAGTGKLVLAKTGGAIAIPGNISLESTAFNGNNSGVVLAANEQIANGAILTWSTVNQNGGQSPTYLRLNGFTETIGGLVSTGNGSAPAIENRGLNDTVSYPTGTLVIHTVESASYSYNGVIRDQDGGTGGGAIAITKSGPGTQILSGTMTYTGPTTIEEGILQIDGLGIDSAILVTSDGTLKGSGSTDSTLTVEAGGTVAPGAGVGTFAAGTTVVNGTYLCDIDGANADRLTVNGSLNLTGSTLTFNVVEAPSAVSYVIASYGTTVEGEFTVVDLPEGYELVHDEEAKEFRLVRPAAGFADFADLNGLSGDPGADFDGDGVKDAVEYVLGTDPTQASGGLPTATSSGSDLVFTFLRDVESLTADVSVSVEVGTSLESWPQVFVVGADTAGSSPGVVVTPGVEFQTITVTVPKGTDVKKFARLNVTVAP